MTLLIGRTIGKVLFYFKEVQNEKYSVRSRKHYFYQWCTWKILLWKITRSTVSGCAERKGINVCGIIDCASPYVIEDIEKFLKTGEAYELKDGGIIYQDKVCILLGSEVETSEIGRNGKKGSAHNICFFPHLSVA